MTHSALFDSLWVGACDPGKQWAVASRPMLVPGGYTLLEPDAWNLHSHLTTGTQAAKPEDVLEVVRQVCGGIRDSIGGSMKLYGELTVLVGIEGAYLKSGFGKKQALSYAMRVGWFQQAFTVHGVTAVIIPPAYGQGGFAWKREVEIAGMSFSEQQKWCHGMFGLRITDEHEADAIALCHFLHASVHKYLSIGMKPHKCIHDGIKAIKKGTANE